MTSSCETITEQALPVPNDSAMSRVMAAPMAESMALGAPGSQVSPCSVTNAQAQKLTKAFLFLDPILVHVTMCVMP